jgi:hypothetical protein
VTRAHSSGFMPAEINFAERENKRLKTENSHIPMESTQSALEEFQRREFSQESIDKRKQQGSLFFLLSIMNSLVHVAIIIADFSTIY